MLPFDLSFTNNIYLEYTLLFIMIIGLILILIGSTYFVINKKNISFTKKRRTDTEKYSNLSIACGISLFLSAIILQIIYCMLNTKCLTYL